MSSSKAPEQYQGPEAVTPEHACPVLADEDDTPINEAERSAALERLALYHARCDDAASACWYLCRSLGAARQLGPEEPGLELLFELLGALADLPTEIAAPASEAVGEADGLGVFELCQQLDAAREASQQAWAEHEEDAPEPLAASPAALLH